MIIVYSLSNPNKSTSIVRKSFPSLRASVMRDFFEVLKDLNLYNERDHNKSEQIYKFKNGSTVEFFSIDNAQKVRGRKRDILFANEANELSFEDYNQLNFRTTNKLYLDFNPSDTHHWLYNLMTRPEATLIKSTYKDNTFLDKSIVKQIEDLILVDEDYYRIYALGEQSIAKSTIYTHQQIVDECPFEIKDTLYGLDFGFNHPTSLVECSFSDDNKIFTKEIIYRDKLTSSDLIREMDSLNISKDKYIICDYARPEIIEDLRRAGYNAKNADKSVKDGIDAVKSSQLFVSKESVNMLNEFRSYKWKTNGDRITDEPVKLWDDAMDAMRYAIKWYKNNGNMTFDYDFGFINF